MSLEDREAIRDLIQRTALMLDGEDFGAWLELFEPDGAYELRAYSPELRRWTIWWQADRAVLQQLLDGVDEHVRDDAQRRHVIAVVQIEFDGDAAHAQSHFSIFRTTPEGRSSLYMVGRYDDKLVRREGRWRYREHHVIADTRMLDVFTHIPV
jgi:3-phenylpropionate/cinnamic acid dioxygenase small subunit